MAEIIGSPRVELTVNVPLQVTIDVLEGKVIEAVVNDEAPIDWSNAEIDNQTEVTVAAALSAMNLLSEDRAEWVAWQVGR